MQIAYDDDYNDDADNVSNTKRLTNQEMEKEFKEIEESIAYATNNVNAQTVIASLNTQDSSLCLKTRLNRIASVESNFRNRIEHIELRRLQFSYRLALRHLLITM